MATAGDGAAATESVGCSLASTPISGGEAPEAAPISSFHCPVCLDLLYKPVVLACGHISCFWCIQKAMHGLRASHCAICRQQYYHFPGICQLLHLLLLKLEPSAYKSRENEVMEEEKSLDCFSPQLEDHPICEKVLADKNNSVALEETENSHVTLKINKSLNLEDNNLQENEQRGKSWKQLHMTDVLCAGCKELLFRPSVLNCGHVYCESCISGPADGPFKCQVCDSLHPGNFPKVCLELDQFLEEQFPKEYVTRREKVQLKILQCQHKDPSFSASETQEQKAKLYGHAENDNLFVLDDLSNTHYGIGCDSCGMYPIIGKRYRCRDCKERVGFDLCEACYNTSSKLPGRFNQQHTPDHRFELDESTLIFKEALLRALQAEESFLDLPEDDMEDHAIYENRNED